MSENANLGYDGYPVVSRDSISMGRIERDWESILELPLSIARIKFLHYRNLYNLWLQRTGREMEELEKICTDNGLDAKSSTFDYWVKEIEGEIFDPEIEDDSVFDQTRRLFKIEVAKAKYAIENNTMEGCPLGDPTPDDRWREALWGVALQFAEMKHTLAQPHPDKGAIELAKKGLLPLELPPIANTKPLHDAVAESDAMQRRLNHFVRRTDSLQRGIGDSAEGIPPAHIQYGPMRSWFFNAKAKENPQLDRDLINLDLQMSLLTGDFVDAVFQHEQEHQEKSQYYPETLDKHRRLAKEAQDKLDELHKAGKGIKVSEEGIKNFDKGSETEKLVRQKMLHNYIFALMQPVWNCAEDNMCDQGVANTGNPLRKKWSAEPLDMAHSSNTMTVLARGIGPKLAGLVKEVNATEVGIEKKKPGESDKKKDEGQSKEASPEEEALAKIQSAILFAFYVRNKLVDDTLKGWEEIGIDISAVQDAKHPELSNEEAYMEMRKLCDKIAETQPIPRHQSLLSSKAYEQMCHDTCHERNEYIDELFERFVQATLDKMIEEFEEKSLDEQIEELKKQMEKRGQQPGTGQGQGQGQQGQGDGIPIEVEGESGNEPGEGEGQGQGEEKDGDGQGQGQGEGEGDEKDGKGGGNGQKEIPRDDTLGDKPGQHNGKDVTEKEGSGGKDWGDARREAQQEGQGPGGKEGNQPGQAGEGEDGKGGLQDFGKPAMGAGAGGQPLQDLELGDGRSWAELREDPKYEEAVEYIADRLRTISQKFPAIVIRHEDIPSLSPTQAAGIGDLAGRLDKESLWDLGVSEQTGDMSLDKTHVFKDDVDVKIASPGDLFLNLDLSGSMGKGVGSRGEAAAKSTAMLYDAAKRAGFGAYINVWGNDVPLIVATPETPVDIAVGKFDRIIQAAVFGKDIPGLQQGTNFTGSMASMLAQLSLERSGESLVSDDDEEVDIPPRQRPRGPVHALYISDGEIFNDPEVTRALEDKNGLTIDACYTEGNKDRLQKLIDTIPDPSGRGHIEANISDVKRIPEELATWAEERYQRVLDQVQANNDEWELTQEKLEQQMDEACRSFCAHNKDINELKNMTADQVIENAREQIENLNQAPATEVSGSGAQLVSSQLETGSDHERIATIKDGGRKAS